MDFELICGVDLMKRLVFFLLYSLLHSQIKETYNISSNEIYSTDLLPQAPKFLIARFGENFELKIPTQNLKGLFASYSLEFVSEYPQITFFYKNSLPLTQVKQKIKTAFLEQYPTIYIKEIRLKPIGKDLNHQKVFELTKIQNAMFKKKTFQILLNTSNGIIPFLCEVDAEIEVYVAKEDIRAREDLDSQNVAKKKVKFEGFLQPPINEQELLSSSARSFIKQDQVITINKIKPKLLVKKGDMIEVSLQESGVSINARLEAMQNGGLGEVIMVKNPTSKKTLKVKITAYGKGEVR